MGSGQEDASKSFIWIAVVLILLGITIVGWTMFWKNVNVGSIMPQQPSVWDRLGMAWRAGVGIFTGG